MTEAEILAKNARRAVKAGLREAEHRFLQLEDLAEYCLSRLSAKKRTLSATAVLAELRAAIAASMDVLKEKEEQQTEDLHLFNKGLFSVDTAVFCRILAERLAASPTYAGMWQSKRAVGDTVCYVKTAQAEKAFSLFAKERPNARVFYISNAEEGFSAVDGMRADYTIMPYETADGVRLLQTERLAERYDLRLVAVFCVTDATMDERVLYALYAKEAAPFALAAKSAAELTLAGGEELIERASAILSVFPYLLVSPKRFYCVPDSHGRMRARFSLEGEDYGALRLFLSLFCTEEAKLDVFSILI